MKLSILTIIVAVLVIFTGCIRSTSSETLLKYQQTGGIARLNNHLIIKFDGKATLIQNDSKIEFSLDNYVIQDIQRKFEEIQFLKMDTEYLPVNTCCDLIVYTITYQGHTVKTMDTAVPQALWTVIEPLNEIVAGVRNTQTNIN